MSTDKNQSTEQFIETRLSREAKTRIKTELLSYMKAHPLRVHTVVSQYAFFFPLTAFIRTAGFKTSAAFLISVFVLGGGTAFAAEKALPGNPLYAVKVNVIEPARGALAVTPESKARFEVAIVKRRLAEAENISLAEDSTNKVKLAEKAIIAAERAEKHLDALAGKNPHAAANVTIEFKAVLKERSKSAGGYSHRGETADRMQKSDDSKELNQLMSSSSEMPPFSHDDDYDRLEKRLEEIEDDLDKRLEAKQKEIHSKIEQRPASYESASVNKSLRKRFEKQDLDENADEDTAVIEIEQD